MNKNPLDKAILPSTESVLELLKLDPGAIKLMKARSKRLQYRAVINWLTHYKCPPEVNDNLELVKGYVEAFYHLAAVEDWERASKILTIKVPPINEDLDTQLMRWGYYEECIQLYSRLLGKLDHYWDSICLSGLGIAYDTLGEYEKAINYHQQYLQIAGETGDRSGEGAALGNLGITYYSLGEYDKAINYHQQCLQIAREIGNRSGESSALGNLGNAYLFLGEYDKAINYHQQCLQIAREIGNRSEEGSALGNWGVALLKLEKYAESLEYSQAALEIFKQIGNPHRQAIALKNIAESHQHLENLDAARQYCDEAIAIFTELGVPELKECQELREKLGPDTDFATDAGMVN
ncbi:tetratricopeptide repeat protein [Okeania sp. KiyG1]|uniref:tetratricopeptide repeat protein n=1 Tax=Okeania sp. KiyG1 TaxID=2720165 RepID=UPI00192140A2|nr:tetratricopeptide repeat protein [Okeania sp. KiyG1]GGA00700.1 hypothetical protein CYANOKiyG1_12450 [Okeania sp. KiyG1]